MPTVEYTRFVHRIWDRLEQRTDRAVFYLDATSIAAHCPACLDGTLRILFAERPEPRLIISSRAGGPGRCSNGCSTAMILEALA